MNKKTYDALASAIYVSRLTVNGGTLDTDDKRLRASGLYDEWTPGDYAAGDIRNAPDTSGEFQTWECFQAHDNAVYPDIVPGNSAWFTFWRPLHGTTPETARLFVPVQGSHDIYKYGEYMIWTNGIVHKCIAPNGTNFSPAEYPGGWEAIQ